MGGQGPTTSGLHRQDVSAPFRPEPLQKAGATGSRARSPPIARPRSAALATRRANWVGLTDLLGGSYTVKHTNSKPYRRAIS